MAYDVFLKMKKVDIKPTSHSYTAVIHAYAVSGWYEKAYAAFENMIREGIQPSIETYTTLLDAFRRDGDNKMELVKVLAALQPVGLLFEIFNIWLQIIMLSTLKKNLYSLYYLCNFALYFKFSAFYVLL
ncbi:unnamed protein product [Vicia faba]|uniref:Pentatricopeptide repeat-containing protein n=1 Tax=Vicia faba TaxID=3906 RepID=A0AAV0YMZ2_VICFA|nr:unnamed protein product [Vicia faba]